MSDNKEELQALKCPSCSGDLVKSSRTYYDDDEEENVTVPLAKCVQCNTEYDQHTQNITKSLLMNLLQTKMPQFSNSA
jgi:uncharacterized protein with PIN domain